MMSIVPKIPDMRPAPPNDGDGQLDRGEQGDGTAKHAKHANPGQCVTELDNAFDFEAAGCH
jgi:hypothetical protein